MIKKTFYSNSIVKTLFFATLITSTFSFTACNEENTDTATVTTEEAIVVLEGALASSTEGIAKETSDAAALALQYAQKSLTGRDCGMTLDSTVSRNVNNARVTASYTTNWKWKVNCNSLQIPTSLDFDRTTNGTYETPRITSNDNSNSDWTIGNLVVGSAWTLNGTYTRNGSQTAQVREQNSFTSELNMNLLNINVNKNTNQISSGTATFQLTGTSTDGDNFSYEGSITFNGNGTATVSINGQTFVIDLR